MLGNGPSSVSDDGHACMLGRARRLRVYRIHRKLLFRLEKFGRSAAWLARLVRDQEVGGSNPLATTILQMYGPERSFTERSEDIVYTFGPTGLFKGCRVLSSRSM
jgi:hypothetical protein